MKNLTILTILLFIFTGCSFQAPQNHNQFKTSTAFSSYINNFLSANDALAKSDLKRSVQHAKKSADFKALANIYLGECALNISVGIDDSCEKYIEIRDLAGTKTTNAYFNLVTNQLQKKEISYLPEVYQNFALQRYNREFISAYEEILEMQNISSQLISASLIKDSLTQQQIEILIKRASFHGYKKSILFWLEELKSLTDDIVLKEKISKKISLLKSKD